MSAPCSPTPGLLAHTAKVSERAERERHAAMEKSRIVTVGISGGRSLTRPFRDARRPPSPGL